MSPVRPELRVAVTTGPVVIPPTYFVLEHLRHLPEVEGHVFAITADVRRPDLRERVSGAAPSGAGGVVGALRTQAAVGRMSREVRRFRPDVVHQHFGTWSLAGARAAQALRVPFLTTLHGYDVFLRSARVSDVWSAITALNLSRTASRSRVLLAVSEWLAGEAVRRGFPAGKVEVHYQGVDTEYFSPGADVGSRDEVPEVLFVGGLVPRKGVRDAVAASLAVVDEHPHVLRVVGGGPLEPFVRQTARDHPHVRYEGSLDRGGVRDAMRSASAFLMPTQRDGEWREAAGLVTLEAQACEVPVIVYASGGTPEMLVDGSTGLLVPEGDTAALSAGLRDVLALTRAEHAAMGAAGRRFVVERRDARASARELLDRYRALAG